MSQWIKCSERVPPLEHENVNYANTAEMEDE